MVRVVGDGSKTLFWEDKWVLDICLACIFLRLYGITFTKYVTLQKVKTEGADIIQFRRTLVGETVVQ